MRDNERIAEGDRAMPSPFPGMDPFIEVSQWWGDFHTRMLGAICAELNRGLPRRYATSVELFVRSHEAEAEIGEAFGKPDIRISDLANPVGVSTVAAPLTVTLPAIRRQGWRFLQIRDIRSRRVVTVIELLSPSNKVAGPDREAYLNKRGDYLVSGVNIVEIDLLRRGRRLPLAEPTPTPGDFTVLVCRAEERPHAGYWTWGLREPLPVIPVPLDPGVADVPLELRPCLDRVYDEGRYDVQLGYELELAPPFSELDAAWAREIVAGLGGGPTP